MSEEEKLPSQLPENSLLPVSLLPAELLLAIFRAASSPLSISKTCQVWRCIALDPLNAKLWVSPPPNLPIPLLRLFVERSAPHPLVLQLHHPREPWTTVRGLLFEDTELSRVGELDFTLTRTRSGAMGESDISAQREIRALMGQHLPGLEVLRLRCRQRPSSSIASNPSSRSEYEQLNFYGPESSQFPALRSLEVEGFNLGAGQYLVGPVNLPLLETLVLRQFAASRAMLGMWMASLPSLRVLHLEQTILAPSVPFPYNNSMFSLPALEELYLFDCDVLVLQMLAGHTRMAKLRKLVIVDSVNGRGNGLQFMLLYGILLARSPTLKDLQMCLWPDAFSALGIKLLGEKVEGRRPTTQVTYRLDTLAIHVNPAKLFDASSQDHSPETKMPFYYPAIYSGLVRPGYQLESLRLTPAVDLPKDSQDGLSHWLGVVARRVEVTDDLTEEMRRYLVL